MEKTAQTIAKELLEKTAAPNISGLAHKAVDYLGSNAKNLGTGVKGMFQKEVGGFNKLNPLMWGRKTRGEHAMNVLKNPLTIGAGALGVGTIGGNIMSKQSSLEEIKEKAYIEEIEKIAKKGISKKIIEKVMDRFSKKNLKGVKKSVGNFAKKTSTKVGAGVLGTAGITALATKVFNKKD